MVLKKWLERLLIWAVKVRGVKKESMMLGLTWKSVNLAERRRDSWLELVMRR